MNIKKLLQILVFITSSYAFTVYVPTMGPLTLSDQRVAGGAFNPGIITATLGIGTANPDLLDEFTTINRFANQIQNFPTKSYQEIIGAISNAYSDLSMQALLAYEKVILYIYAQRAYAWKTNYLPGIRYSWINPLSWIDPRSWISDNDNELNQLINELDQLANIAYNKKPLVGMRMKQTVHLYRHWRKYVLAGITTYLCYDIGKHEQKDTKLYKLIHLFDKSNKNNTPNQKSLFGKIKSFWQTPIEPKPVAPKPIAPEPIPQPIVPMPEKDIMLKQAIDAKHLLQEHYLITSSTAEQTHLKAIILAEKAKNIAHIHQEQDKIFNDIIKKHHQEKNPWILNKLEDAYDYFKNFGNN